MQATIRKLRVEDIEQVNQLYERYMPINASRALILRRAIERDDSEMLVAEKEGNIVGVLDQVFYSDLLHNGACSNILFLYVAEPFRRQNVGRLLLDSALNSAAARGVIEVHVSTRTGNLPAITLYEKAGFEHAGPLFECAPEKQKVAVNDGRR
jgi:ribosomal protein S18 acetylase RimI-like enzyme